MRGNLPKSKDDHIWQVFCLLAYAIVSSFGLRGIAVLTIGLVRKGPSMNGDCAFLVIFHIFSSDDANSPFQTNRTDGHTYTEK